MIIKTAKRVTNTKIPHSKADTMSPESINIFIFVSKKSSKMNFPYNFVEKLEKIFSDSCGRVRKNIFFTRSVSGNTTFFYFGPNSRHFHSRANSKYLLVQMRAEGAGKRFYNQWHNMLAILLILAFFENWSSGEKVDFFLSLYFNRIF